MTGVTTSTSLEDRARALASHMASTGTYPKNGTTHARTFQEVLKAAGHYNGPIDGVIGRGSKTAYRAFAGSDNRVRSNEFVNAVRGRTATAPTKAAVAPTERTRPTPSQQPTAPAQSLEVRARALAKHMSQNPGLPANGSDHAKTLQEILRNAGHYNGPIDRILGNGSRTAFRNFVGSDNKVTTAEFVKAARGERGPEEAPATSTVSTRNISLADRTRTLASNMRESGALPRNGTPDARTLQEVLALNDHYTGRIDGVLGRGSRAGIDSFWPDGRINPADLIAEVNGTRQAPAEEPAPTQATAATNPGLRAISLGGNGIADQPREMLQAVGRIRKALPHSSLIQNRLRGFEELPVGEQREKLSEVVSLFTGGRNDNYTRGIDRALIARLRTEADHNHGEATPASLSTGAGSYNLRPGSRIDINGGPELVGLGYERMDTDAERQRHIDNGTLVHVDTLDHVRHSRANPNPHVHREVAPILEQAGKLYHSITGKDLSFLSGTRAVDYTIAKNIGNAYGSSHPFGFGIDLNVHPGEAGYPEMRDFFTSRGGVVLYHAGHLHITMTPPSAFPTA